MKTLRFLLSAVMLVALLAGMQLTAYATVTSPANDEASRLDENAVSRIEGNEVPLAANELARGANDEASRIADEFSLPDNAPMPTEKDIYPISANPDTGANGLAIPAIVALLAASTAAITLSSKKK